MAFRTRITELLGIELPILCGGLMWLADARYVAAVVRAGAMGFITARTFPDPGAFRAELQLARELTGGRPFGVNLHLSARPEENTLIEGHIAILLEAGVRIVETSGVPPKAILPPLKEAGATVVHKVSAVRHAVSAERLGVDAVAVVGAECGGHPGLHLIGTIVQAPRAAQAVGLPLAIGGGIGHGSQLAALLAMGADAAVIGTRLLVAEEIWGHPDYKARVAAADETMTRLVMQSFRNTYRAMDTEAARQVEALEKAGEVDFEAYRPLVAGTNQKRAYQTGDVEGAILSLGQAACFAERIEPAAAILHQLMAEAEAARRRLDGLAVETADV
ncbi:nitronate monooxygenase [Tistlia consotensis]|uniref:Nitronate monooxygenase n=1 Tax=Tistlia consotensis USBA 355 TaxID=560819 RepID=A0A1Y6BW10_9PROT|nr:nitronate monooxygenase [Tistlia consotensis]SMF30201.1 nitronate monooxygenase [Tistlia consotensis USBA 355]SNR90304.1 nitronate monooxygenase [Tistlia consotensis]